MWHATGLGASKEQNWDSYSSMLSYEICTLTLYFSSFSLKVLLFTAFQQRIVLVMPRPCTQASSHCSKTAYIVAHSVHPTILFYTWSRHRNYAYLTEPPRHPWGREIRWDKSYTLLCGAILWRRMEKRNSYFFRLLEASCFLLNLFNEKNVFKKCGWKEWKINNLTWIIKSV